MKTIFPLSPTHIFDKRDVDLNDLPIALRKGKRSSARYPISQFVSSKNISLQHSSFILAIDSINIPTIVQETLK